jgi:hypothetical protein
MAEPPSTVFRFSDLPSEIRNKIYRELLCDFRPRPTTMDPYDVLSFAPARRDIDTTILRTNKTVYLEAHDVLVKTNRFVKVTSVRGLPVRLLLNSLQVPVVTSDKKAVDAFKGYVLGVHLGCATPFPTTGDPGLLDPCNVMLLHRDMDVFCSVLADGDARRPGFSENLQMSLTVAPILKEK